MASDANLKCSQFRCTMAVSYCSTKCAYPGRAGKQCADLARFSTEKPAEMRSIVASVHAGTMPNVTNPLSPVFKSAFPDYLPDGVAAPVSAPPQTALIPKKPEPKAAAKAASTAPAATPPSAPTHVAPAPVPPAAQSSKPTDPVGKDRTMTSPDSAAASATSTAGDGTEAPKRRGGLRKGQKINRRKKVNASSTGLMFFIETEKGSNVFSLMDEPSMGDFLQMRTAGRRVIGALEAKEL